MDILESYTKPLSAGYYQSARGLHSALVDTYGKEIAPTFAQTKRFLDNQPNDYLQVPRESATKKLKPGESARWYLNSAVGVLQADCMYGTRNVAFGILFRVIFSF